MSEFAEGLIVSVSGIRGRVGRELMPEVVARFAAAFGSFAIAQGWGDRIALARDSRPSGPAFLDAAAAGLRSVGCHVSDLGLVPTPTALLAIQDRQLSGGIVITASHNPREWNALKLASPEGAFLTPEQGRAFLEMLGAEEPPSYSAWDGYGSREGIAGSIAHHIERILDLELVDPALIASRRIALVADAARGAGGAILSDLFTRLGCEVSEIEFETDGLFSREPEPIPENVGTLCETVASGEAELGMAVDPDVDRLALVEGTGRPIGEDFTLALASRLVLAHRPGPVVANLSTSQVLEDVCRAAGVAFHRSPVGEANVAAAMKEVGAVIGGEGNGGVILPALHYTRDAPLAVALILQLLAESERDLADIVAEYPQYRIIKDRAPRSKLELDDLAAEIDAAFPGAVIDRRDGLHLRWEDDRLWLHVRPSGTEPIVRLIAEGPVGEEGRIRELIEISRSVVSNK